MTTALLILGCIAVICLIGGIVLIAVRVSEALSKQADVLDRAHERWVKSLDPIFDRLMAHNWEEYITIRSATEEDEGGFLSPDEQEQRPGVEIRTPWGSLVDRDAIERMDEEDEKLLNEDFDEDGEPITDIGRRRKQAEDRGLVPKR